MLRFIVVSPFGFAGIAGKKKTLTRSEIIKTHG